MPKEPTRNPTGNSLHDNLAAIDPLQRNRRRSRWALNPHREPSATATADASRFITEAKLLQGLGRKPVNE